MFLEIARQENSARPLTVAVRVKSLSAAGVILAGAGEAEEALLAVSGGEKAVVRLPDSRDPELTAIHGRIQWARPGDDPVSDFEVGMELADPNLRVRKVLEDHLGAYPQDIKDLWDQWDRLHVGPLGLPAEQAVYYVGGAAMVGGSLFYLTGPESYKLFGTILAFYGCLLGSRPVGFSAFRSTWASWPAPTDSPASTTRRGAAGWWQPRRPPWDSVTRPGT